MIYQRVFHQRLRESVFVLKADLGTLAEGTVKWIRFLQESS